MIIMMMIIMMIMIIIIIIIIDEQNEWFPGTRAFPGNGLIVWDRNLVRSKHVLRKHKQPSEYLHLARPNFIEALTH